MIHTHPGFEALYVLSCQLGHRTSVGVAQVNAENVVNGHEPSMLIQLESTGTWQLNLVVMFVVDVARLFPVPPSF